MSVIKWDLQTYLMIRALDPYGCIHATYKPLSGTSPVLAEVSGQPEFLDRTLLTHEERPYGLGVRRHLMLEWKLPGWTYVPAASSFSPLFEVLGYGCSGSNYFEVTVANPVQWRRCNIGEFKHEPLCGKNVGLHVTCEFVAAAPDPSVAMISTVLYW